MLPGHIEPRMDAVDAVDANKFYTSTQRPLNVHSCPLMSIRGPLPLLFLSFQMREQNHIADRFCASQHHDQAVDP